MKPICVRCRLFYRPTQNGIRFEEGMPTAGGWTGYKLWIGDLWECQSCGHQLIVGVGRGPIAEHFQPGYAERVVREGAVLRVDDC